MNRRIRYTIAAAALTVATGLAAPASATAAGVGDAYALTSSVSPAPLTGADCAADPACVAAPAPSGGADDQPAIAAAVATAASRSAPAIVDSAGAVLTPARQGTVRLAPGTYRMGRPLQLPPNVNLRGAGITATTLLLAPGSWRNFGYSFLIRPNGGDSPASANLVSDLTVNGSCKVGAGAPDPTMLPSLTCDLGASENYGGGVKAGNRWTVRQIRFTNLNYFKLWVSAVNNVTVTDNRWDNWGGAGSGDEDNIGGGGFAADGLIEHNQWDETIRGNGIDLTNATRMTIRDNTVHATPFYLNYRNVGDYGTFIMEGVTASTIADNVLYGSHIVLQSNSRYEHSGNNVNVTNARNMTVTGNRIVGSFWAGITASYDDYDDVDPATGLPRHTTVTGGGNLIAGNTITRPTYSGILVFGRQNKDKTLPDTVTDNTIVNAGAGGATYYCGFDTVAIGIGIGSGDTVTDNVVADDPAAPTTWYGVQLGQRGVATTVTGTVLSGNSGATIGGLGGFVRQTAGAVEAPTMLTATGGVLTWKESYATAQPIAGYRVYRNGFPVATMAPGSATVPGNLLSAAQSSVESGLAGWTPAPRTSIGWRGTTGGVGNASIAITSTGAGQIAAYGPPVSVTAGATYTSVATFQGPGGRRVRAGMAWLDANGAVISRVTSANSSTVASATGWLTSSYTAVAPANAVAAQLFLPVDSTLVGETFLIDRMGLTLGSATEMWTDPAPAAGTTYQVVAFRAGDGENSLVAKVTV